MQDQDRNILKFPKPCKASIIASMQLYMYVVHIKTGTNMFYLVSTAVALLHSSACPCCYTSISKGEKKSAWMKVVIHFSKKTAPFHFRFQLSHCCVGMFLRKNNFDRWWMSCCQELFFLLCISRWLVCNSRYKQRRKRRSFWRHLYVPSALSKKVAWEESSCGECASEFGCRLFSGISW